ncbi:MAG: restriction endonuclease subunit S [Syntrophorhabdaceae bacterium]|nr:restriction endonuclease subunit S [Syntrophorhabdaceae bacterium]
MEWLGEIPEHWSTQKLKFNSYIKGRIGWQNLRGDEFTDAGPYLVTGMHFKDGSVDWNSCYHITEDRYLMAPEIFVQEGDVLITKDGSIGKLAYIDQLPGKASLNSHLLIIRPVGDAYTSRFLYHLLGSELFQRFVVIEQKGTTFYGITQESVEGFPAVLPSSDEQRSIASFLDRETGRIDELIARKQRQIDLLQEKRSALISHVVTKGLDPDVKMKDSGVEWLGEVPGHWDVYRLRVLLKDCEGIKIGPFGSALRLEYIQEDGYKVYGQEHLINADFSLGHKYIDEDKFEELIMCEILPGDLVVSMMGTTGKCQVVPEGIERGIMDSHLLRLRPNESVFPFYLALLINDSDCIRYQITTNSKGSIMEGLNSFIIKELLVALPSLTEQRSIVAFLDRETSHINELIEKVKKSIDLLREYRTALISAAVTGKIDVREEVA